MNKVKRGGGALTLLLAVAVVAVVAPRINGGFHPNDEYNNAAFYAEWSPRILEKPANITYGVNTERVHPRQPPTTSPWRDSKKYRPGNTAYLNVTITTNDPKATLECMITAATGERDIDDKPRRQGNQLTVTCTLPPPDL